MFGEFADIANASKHLVVKPVSLGVGDQQLSALGTNGVIKGLEFSIGRSGGEDIDLLMFSPRFAGLGKSFLKMIQPLKHSLSMVIFYSPLFRSYLYGRHFESPLIS